MEKFFVTMTTVTGKMDFSVIGLLLLAVEMGRVHPLAVGSRAMNVHRTQERCIFCYFCGFGRGLSVVLVFIY